MRFTKILTTAAIVALVGTSAMAQTTAPSTTAPSATTTTATPMATTKPAAGTMSKKTPVLSDVSKACSAQADAKGLHGKDRKTFRSTCKKNGGKA